MNDLEGKVICIVRVRGIRNIKPKIKHTLKLLRLHKPNHCVVYKATKPLLGMLKVVKDYVTFGEVDEKTLERLIMKRGEKGSEKVNKELAKKIVDEIKKEGKVKSIDPVFRLHPPRKGWKNIKKAYPFGSLGFRDNMSFLLNRMM